MNWRYKEFRILLNKIYFCVLPFSTMRSRWLKKHDIFQSCGEQFFFQPRKIPMEPKLIKFGNNVKIAANVTFVTHDAIHLMLREIDSKDSVQHLGCIEVGDNVFIGAGTFVLPNVKIGSNVIIAAGAIVTNDVEDGIIVGGNPARKIGDFEALKNRRNAETELIRKSSVSRIEYEWTKFYIKHAENKYK